MKAVKPLAPIVIFLLCAAPVAAQTSYEDAQKLAQQYSAGQHGEQPPMPDAIELSDKDVSGFIHVIEEFNELDADVKLDIEESGPMQMSEALAANQQALALLGGRGFTPERFQQVAYSIGYAMAAIEMKGKEGQIDQALAAQEEALKKMEGRLSAEQIEMIRKQTGMAKQSLHQIEDQPAGNVQLVEKNLVALRRAIEKLDRHD